MSKEINKRVCKNLKFIENNFKFLNKDRLKELKESVCKVSCSSICTKQYFETDEDIYGKRAGYYKTEELYDADPNCEHYVINASGGGIKCAKCNGWFCY